MEINGLTFGDWIGHFLWLVGYVSFLWVPIVLAGYSVGRRRVSIRSVMIFMLIEGVALALSLYLYHRLQAEKLVY